MLDDARLFIAMFPAEDIITATRHASAVIRAMARWSLQRAAARKRHAKCAEALTPASDASALLVMVRETY